MAAACFRFQRVEFKAARIACDSASSLALVTCSRMGALTDFSAGSCAFWVGGAWDGNNGLPVALACNSRARISVFRRTTNLRTQFPSSRALPAQWERSVARFGSWVILGAVTALTAALPSVT